jgi:ribokinase
MSVLVIGSLNVDLVFKTKRAPEEGETVAGIDFNMFPGGKGANQAVAIKRLEGNVMMAGALGTDTYASFYHRVLVDEGMDENHIKTVEGPSGLASITVDEKGQNRIVIIHGANYSFLPKDVDAIEDEIEKSNICLTQLEMRMETVERLAYLCHKHSKTFILNPAPVAKLSDKLLKNISIITPNEHELGLLSGIEIKGENDLVLGARHLIEKGVSQVVVTLGSKGALYVDNKTSQIIPTYKVKPVDTTGAGDAFNGALAYCLDKDMDILQAIKFANKVGALTVTKRGALVSLPKLKEVNNAFKK